MKSNISLASSPKFCELYAKILENYIKDVDTDHDYAPFIRKFTATDIKNMYNYLPDKCPTHTNTYVTEWLDRIHKLKITYNQFITKTPRDKLKYLRENHQVGRNNTHCAWYAMLLESYINDVKNKYTEFTIAFTDDEIDKMIRCLRSDKCPNKSYDNVIDWLKQHGE